MAKFTVTLTSDTFTKICDIVRRRGDANNWTASAFVYGTFGSGTATFQISPNNGTTRFTGKDWTGSSMTSTAAAMFTFQPQGNGTELTEYLSVYGALAGSTAASVTFEVWDNR